MWISLFSRVWGDISSRKKTTGIKTTTGLFFPLSITKVSIPLENFQASKHTTNGDFQKKNGYSTIIPIWLGTIIPYKTSINPKQPQGPNFIAHIETKKNHLTLQVASHRPERLRNFEPDGRTRGTPVGLLTWSSNDAKKSKKKHLRSKKKVSRFQKKMRSINFNQLPVIYGPFQRFRNPQRFGCKTLFAIGETDSHKDILRG